MRVSIFVTATDDDIIGNEGQIPWYLPESSRHLQALITGSVIIVGNHTYQTIIREIKHPLPGTLTVVLTQSPWPGLQVIEDRYIVLYQPTIQSALKLAKAFTWFLGKKELFIIGGAHTYAAALPHTDRIYLTRIHADIPGDAKMPLGWLDDFTLNLSPQEQWSVNQTAVWNYSFRQYNRTVK